MKSKRGETPTWVVLLLIVAIGFLLLGGQKAPTAKEKEETTVIPSSGLFTWSLEFTDKLATSGTPVIASYYIFDSANKLVASGTASSSGLASEDLAFGVDKTYTVIGVNGTGSTAGYYYGQKSYTISNLAKDKTTVYLVKEGMGKITTIQDPTDLNSEISTSLGASKSFNILIEQNVSKAGYQEPVIVVDYNSTSIQSVEISNTEEVTCPTRISVPLNTTSASARKLKCLAIDKSVFYYDKENLGYDSAYLTSKDGTLTLTGSISFSSSSATASTDGILFKVEDRAMYVKPGANTKDGFVVAMEDDSDVDTGATGCGSSQACVSWLGFNG